MTPPERLLAELRSLGATLTVDGVNLRVLAPSGSVTPELRAGLLLHKPALIELVQTGACSSPEDWLQEMRAAFAPILHLTPEACLAPRVCRRIGPCGRRRTNFPCDIAGSRLEPDSMMTGVDAQERS